MMKKFWFASGVGVPLMLLMLAELVPAWREALMPYHRQIGIASAVLTLPVLAWSGRQFFESAWNGLRNHNTNMDTLVAVGTGADVAIEAADVTLVGGSLRGVVTAVEVSRATLRNIRQNLFGAFVYNALGVPLAAGVLYPLTGLLLSPIIAGAAMAASSITVVTNANRLRLFEPQAAK